MSYPSALHRLLFAAFLLLLAACGTLQRDKQEATLEAALDAYGKALRWGYYENANALVHPAERRQVPEYLEKVRVTRYEVLLPPSRSGAGAATQRVRIEYVHDDVQQVRKLTDLQTWRYDPATKTWWLHSGMPAFR